MSSKTRTLIAYLPALLKIFSQAKGFSVFVKLSMTLPASSVIWKLAFTIWPSASVEPEASKVMGLPT